MEIVNLILAFLAVIYIVIGMFWAGILILMSNSGKLYWFFVGLLAWPWVLWSSRNH